MNLKDYTAADLAAYKDQLNAREYEVLLGCLTDPYAKVAAHLSIPVGTVKSRMHRSFRKLTKLKKAAAHAESQEQLATNIVTGGAS